jgi:hypothetical protein
VIVTIAKSIRSEIQAIVNEGLWGEDINLDIIARMVTEGTQRIGSPSGEKLAS